MGRHLYLQLDDERLERRPDEVPCVPTAAMCVTQHRNGLSSPEVGDIGPCEYASHRSAAFVEEESCSLTDSTPFNSRCLNHCRRGNNAEEPKQYAHSTRSRANVPLWRNAPLWTSRNLPHGVALEGPSLDLERPDCSDFLETRPAGSRCLDQVISDAVHELS